MKSNLEHLSVNAERVGRKLIEMNRESFDQLAERLLTKEHRLPGEIVEFFQQHDVKSIPFDLFGEKSLLPSVTPSLEGE